MKRDQSGGAPALVAIILLAIMSVGLAIFAVWSYNGRQQYKNESDQLSALAVADASKKLRSELEQQFAEQSKLPYKTYKGSSTFGSLSFRYPKNWSAYVAENASNKPIDGYFHPNIVPGTQSNQAYALRVELVNNNYASMLQQQQSAIKSGQVKARAYVPPKMANVANVQKGIFLTGTIDRKFSGQMVMIKVRDKTLKIYTQSNSHTKDFNNVVLKNLTFVP